MAQKIVDIPGIGEVILAKRRGSTHMRLSITAKGTVRVGMPYWTPYGAGVNFVRSRADWIKKHLEARAEELLTDGSRIGKAHRLFFRLDESRKTVSSTIRNTEILISGPKPYTDKLMQDRARKAAEKALKSQAEQLLPLRLAQLAKKHGYTYKEVRIRKLTSRWGSCSSHKIITLSFYLMQLPWPLIDYVLVHELLHTRFMHHGPKFWAEFEQILPGAKKIRKQVNSHSPRVQPVA